jgi:hypothetical protein
MRWREGDRVFVEVADGPTTRRRYGSVCLAIADTTLISVALDGDQVPAVMDSSELHPATVDTLTLPVADADVLMVPALRAALVDMWEAEASAAGIAVAGIHRMTTTAYDGEGTWLLAEVVARGTSYVLQAGLNEAGLLAVFCRRQNRYDF